LDKSKPITLPLFKKSNKEIFIDQINEAFGVKLFDFIVESFKQTSQTIKDSTKNQLIDLTKPIQENIENIKRANQDGKLSEKDTDKYVAMIHFMGMLDDVNERNKLNPVFQSTLLDYFSEDKNKMLKGSYFELFDTEHVSEYKTYDELCNAGLDVKDVIAYVKPITQLDSSFISCGAGNPPNVYQFSVNEDRFKAIADELVAHSNNKSFESVKNPCKDDPDFQEHIIKLNQLKDKQLEYLKQQKIIELSTNSEHFLKQFSVIDENVEKFKTQYKD
jgi:hypothetical protein